MKHSLDILRKSIDKIDINICDLLVQRFKIVEDVKQYKLSQNSFTTFIKPQREYDLILNLQNQYKDSLVAEMIFEIWRNIISISLIQEMNMDLILPSSNPILEIIALQYFSLATPISFVNAESSEAIKNLLLNLSYSSVALLILSSDLLDALYDLHKDENCNCYIYAIFSDLRNIYDVKAVGITPMDIENFSGSQKLYLVRNEDLKNSEDSKNVIFSSDRLSLLSITESLSQTIVGGVYLV